MTEKKDASNLSRIGKRLLFTGGACILGTVIAMVGAGVYEWLHPSGTHLLQPLAMLLPWTVIPIGCIALILGVLLRFIAYVTRPRRSK